MNVSNKSKFSLLTVIERIGNKLPHPFMLFVYLAVIVIFSSYIVSLFDVSVIHPSTKEVITVNNLLSKEGFIYILSSLISNFTSFTPFGLVLVIMLGIGLAQKVGFFETFMKVTILRAPKRIVTYSVIFAGVLGNIASDAANIFIPPLAAMVFYALGRHPIAGMAAGFAGVGAGFTSNFLITGTDALLSGISSEFSVIVDPTSTVTPVDNWFFLSSSVFLIVIVLGIITEKIIEPRLGPFNPKYAVEGTIGKKTEEVTVQDMKGLRNVGIATIIYLIFIALLIVPENGLLRGEGGQIIPSPFLSNIVPMILGLFILVGIVYGKTVGTIKNIEDIPIKMGEAMRDLSTYIVFVFAAAQFIAYFNWSNLSLIIAVNSAEYISSLNMSTIFMLIMFIVLSSILNLFIVSGSAQWAVMAPIFIPLFMLLDLHPAAAQLAFRIGDSSSNIITPMNPYLIMVLGLMRQYDKRVGLGTIISIMIPYTVLLLTVWIIYFVIWYLIGLPIGPGVHI